MRVRSFVKRWFLRWWSPFLVVFLFVIIVTLVDWWRIQNYPIHPRRPTEKIQLEQDQIYRELKSGITDVDWSRLNGTLEYISKEYDCADFRLVNLIRIMYEFEEQIPAQTKMDIERVLFDFRYWWDDPGENSMCYWSENHQILFASAEYLIGQKYPDIVFQKSGLTGLEHQEKARIRLLDWLEMRWNYGFIEFFSEVYYKEDIGALINLIDYAEDEEIVVKTKMIMDLLMYDVATQSLGTVFNTVSGRAYSGNRKGGPGQQLGGVTNYFWGDGSAIKSGMTHGLMYSNKYELPPVLKAIASDTSNLVVKQSNGLNLDELAIEGYFGTDNRSMMMQWGMEAFSNPEVIGNSMDHIRNARFFSNDFIKDFRYLDFWLLRWFGLEKSLSKTLKAQSDGVAIQKGNTYTYKTSDYTIYTAQRYHPGTFGDQQHVTGINLAGKTSVFHNHPAIEKDVERQSPNYWVGYGHFPDVVQDSSISLAIYQLPDEKRWLEADLLHYTHAYFPTEKFDSSFVDENYAFAKIDDSYCAIIAHNELTFREESTDDLIQQGQSSFWIIEAGSKKQDGSFAAFIERIRSNAVSFASDAGRLKYISNGNILELQFNGDFLVNNSQVNVDYPRYDSPYANAQKKDKTIEYHHQGLSLFLDFDNLIREF